MLSRLLEDGYLLLFVLDRKVRVSGRCEELLSVGIPVTKRNFPWAGMTTTLVMGLAPFDCSKNLALPSLEIKLRVSDIALDWDRIIARVFEEELPGLLSRLREKYGVECQLLR